jgi:uncharacterized protein (TIGR02246 family)
MPLVHSRPLTDRKAPGAERAQPTEHDVKTLSLAAAAALTLSALPANAAPPAEADRQALTKLATDNDTAWNVKDAATILGQYAAEGTLRVGHDSSVLAGREAIGRFFDAAFARRPDGFRHVTRIDHIEMITPDMALADGYVRVERAGDNVAWTLVREFRSNSLVVREGGEWRLHSVRAHPLS